MAIESQLWKSMRDAPAARADDIHMHRIENSVGRAMPDVEGQAGYGHFHIELKVLRDITYIGTKNESGRLKFQIGQREWAQKRWAVGGISYVMIEGFHSDVYMVPGAYAMKFDRLGTVKTALLQDLCCMSFLKSPDSWDSLFALLRRPEVIRGHVQARLLSDPQLAKACEPTSEIDRLLSSLPDA